MSLKFDSKWPILHLFFCSWTPWKGTLSEVHTLFKLHSIRLGPSSNHHLNLTLLAPLKIQLLAYENQQVKITSKNGLREDSPQGE